MLKGLALTASGLPDVQLDILALGDVEKRIQALLPRFGGAQATIQHFRTERLQEVAGHFVEPDVLVQAQDGRQPALAALDAWLASEAQTALVLGEFGCGKSTLLAAWAWQRWLRQTTHDMFSDAHKIVLAEALPEQLWRSGAPAVVHLCARGGAYGQRPGAPAGPGAA